MFEYFKWYLANDPNNVGFQFLNHSWLSYVLWILHSLKEKSCMISHDLGSQFTSPKREISCSPNCSHNKTMGLWAVEQIAQFCWNQILSR